MATRKSNGFEGLDDQVLLQQTAEQAREMITETVDEANIVALRAFCDRADAVLGDLARFRASIERLKLPVRLAPVQEIEVNLRARVIQYRKIIGQQEDPLVARLEQLERLLGAQGNQLEQVLAGMALGGALESPEAPPGLDMTVVNRVAEEWNAANLTVTLNMDLARAALGTQVPPEQLDASARAMIARVSALRAAPPEAEMPVPVLNPRAVRVIADNWEAANEGVALTEDLAREALRDGGIDETLFDTAIPLMIARVTELRTEPEATETDPATIAIPAVEALMRERMDRDEESLPDDAALRATLATAGIADTAAQDTVLTACRDRAQEFVTARVELRRIATDRCSAVLTPRRVALNSEPLQPDEIETDLRAAGVTDADLPAGVRIFTARMTALLAPVGNLRATITARCDTVMDARRLDLNDTPLGDAEIDAEIAAIVVRPDMQAPAAAVFRDHMQTRLLQIRQERQRVIDACDLVMNPRVQALDLTQLDPVALRAAAVASVTEAGQHNAAIILFARRMTERIAEVRAHRGTVAGAADVLLDPQVAALNPAILADPVILAAVRDALADPAMHAEGEVVFRERMRVILDDIRQMRQLVTDDCESVMRPRLTAENTTPLDPTFIQGRVATVLLDTRMHPAAITMYTARMTEMIAEYNRFCARVRGIANAFMDARILAGNDSLPAEADIVAQLNLQGINDPDEVYIAQGVFDVAAMQRVNRLVRENAVRAQAVALADAFMPAYLASPNPVRMLEPIAMTHVQAAFPDAADRTLAARTFTVRCNQLLDEYTVDQYRRALVLDDCRAFVGQRLYAGDETVPTIPDIHARLTALSVPALAMDDMTTLYEHTAHDIIHDYQHHMHHNVPHPHDAVAAAPARVVASTKFVSSIPDKDAIQKKFDQRVARGDVAASILSFLAGKGKPDAPAKSVGMTFTFRKKKKPEGAKKASKKKGDKHDPDDHGDAAVAHDDHHGDVDEHSPDAHPDGHKDKKKAVVAHDDKQHPDKEPVKKADDHGPKKDAHDAAHHPDKDKEKLKDAHPAHGHDGKEKKDKPKDDHAHKKDAHAPAAH